MAPCSSRLCSHLHTRDMTTSLELLLLALLTPKQTLQTHLDKVAGICDCVVLRRRHVGVVHACTEERLVGVVLGPCRINLRSRCSN